MLFNPKASLTHHQFGFLLFQWGQQGAPKTHLPAHLPVGHYVVSVGPRTAWQHTWVSMLQLCMCVCDLLTLGCLQLHLTCFGTSVTWSWKVSCWEAGLGTDCGPVGTAAVTESLSGAGRLLMNEGQSLTSAQTALTLCCTVSRLVSPPWLPLTLPGCLEFSSCWLLPSIPLFCSGPDLLSPGYLVLSPSGLFPAYSSLTLLIHL